MNGIFFFGMSNALINPLIYGAFHIRDAAIHQVKHSDAPDGGQMLCVQGRGKSEVIEWETGAD